MCASETARKRSAQDKAESELGILESANKRLDELSAKLSAKTSQRQSALLKT
jgi:hypothetical protein